MKITDDALLAAIATHNYAELNDGLFAIVGQQFLIDVMQQVGRDEDADESIPDVVWVAHTGYTGEHDYIANASETGKHSIWERCNQMREVHVFTTWEETLQFFTEFVTRHNHLV